LGEGERFANWTLAKWQSFGLAQTSIVEYPFPIPFTRPTYQKLALLSQKSNYPAGGGDTESQFEEEEVYNARLRENTTYINPVSGKIVSTPQFLLNTPNGDVTAQYVYVNFGTAGDYDDLERLNIELRGKIVIRKQGGPDDFRALETARDRGVVGMIAYLDPQFDGNVTEANGYRGYPEGPARSPHSIFRRCGIVPTRTLPNGTRVVNTVQLPVTPISYTEAVPFLRALNGHGPLAADIGAGWRGGQLGYLGVEYNVGPSPESLVVHLVNEMESSNVSAYNVIGIINGTLDNEAIILGNHRDALGAGAGDSNSGSAAFNEVIRSFGIAMKRGWKPLRTIVFASWDGHEAGTWGSGFWVQHHLPWLSHASVAYLEVETAGTGTEFFAKASPLLHNVLHDATRRVLSPDQTRPGQRVRDGWDGRLKTQAGGDTTYFLLNGIASMSFGFAPADTDPVFHWHSDYDTVEWIDRYGDPTWGYHGASAQVWALAAAWLAGDPIIPFNITAYAVALDGYLKGLRQETGGPEERPQVSQVMPSPCSFNLEPLSDAISRLVVAATAFDTATQALREHLNSHSGTSEHIQNRNSDQSSQIARVNNKYKLFERQFVYRANAPGAGPRHVIYSPSSFKTDMPAFPELTLAIRRNDWCEAEVSSELYVFLVP
jgi:N-acetylated-alpha-linked acidic dipeptidase